MPDPEENSAITTLIREELARQNRTRQWLADAAKISISTLEKGLSGRRHFTLATLVKLEAALAINLRNPAGPGTRPQVATTPGYSAIAGIAPENMGSYSQQAVGDMAQRYLTVRPSFGNRKNCLFSYCTEIMWDDTLSQLVFEESGRTDAEFTQAGLVSVPHKSGHIYLVTNRHGQHRMITLSRPTIRDEMFGILLSLQVRPGSQLSPAATPIALSPMTNFAAPVLGLVEAHHSCYKDYAALLRKAMGDGYCSFIQ